MLMTRRQTLLGFVSALAITAAGLPAFAADAGEFTGAKVDWQQFKGQEINLLFVRHPWQEAIEPLVPQFEELTGIKVNLRKLPEPQFLAKVPADLTAGTFQFDRRVSLSVRFKY